MSQKARSGTSVVARDSADRSLPKKYKKTVKNSKIQSNSFNMSQQASAASVVPGDSADPSPPKKNKKSVKNSKVKSNSLNMSQQASSGTSDVPGDSADPSPPKTHQTDVTHDAFDRSTTDKELIRMICINLLPIQILKNEGFLDFIESLNLIYNRPSKQLAKNILFEQYSKAKTEIMDILHVIDNVSVSVDRWNSKFINSRTDRKNMITLTVHYIHGMEFKSQTLSTKTLSTEEETKDGIGDVLKQILKEWRILDKVVCIVTNDWKSKQAVISYLQIPHVECVALSLNRVIISGLKLFYLKFLDKQYLGDINIPFDWYRKVSSSQDELHPNVREFIRILEPFNELIDLLSSDSYPSLSCILPLLNIVKLSVEKSSPTTKEAITFRKMLLSEIYKRFNYNTVNEFIAKSTFFDPRFKRVGLEYEALAASVHRAVIDELNDNGSISEQEVEMSSPTSNTSSEVNAEKSSGNLWSNFDKKVSHAFRSSSVVDQYENLPYLKRDDNPYKFWEDRKNSYSNLYRIAKKYSCIPATSISMEQISKAYYKYDPRSRLDLEIADQMLFLQSYYS